ncbi:unnamed protein product [Boreogadus saida]
MSTQGLKLNLDNTELLFNPGKASPIHDLSVNINCNSWMSSRRKRTQNEEAKVCVVRIVFTSGQFDAWDVSRLGKQSVREKAKAQWVGTWVITRGSGKQHGRGKAKS